MIEIPYPTITVEEAVNLLKRYGGYLDGDKQAVIIEEEGERC